MWIKIINLIVLIISFANADYCGEGCDQCDCDDVPVGDYPQYICECKHCKNG